MSNKQPGFKIVRTFNAPKEMVFGAFSTADAMAEWWGPVGMPVTVKELDFRAGGKFHYRMEGNGQVMWGIMRYQKIQPHDLLEFITSFSDEAGNIAKSPFPIDFPLEVYNVLTFEENNGSTTLTLSGGPVNATKEQEEVYTSMFGSMQQGFKGTFDQLEQYIEARFRLRDQLKTNKMARVSTYLNFPGNTEEAMNFYKTVFRSEFTGGGIQRFGDIPAGTGQPPVADNLKKMVLHVELPILGGHVLMATDAPKEMGFTLTPGNNMHISLEPETREETKRLFDEISAGGNITMPLADMFWGAYFGSCTDRYGINWMFNCTEKK